MKILHHIRTLCLSEAAQKHFPVVARYAEKHRLEGLKQKVLAQAISAEEFMALDKTVAFQDEAHIVNGEQGIYLGFEYTAANGEQEKFYISTIEARRVRLENIDLLPSSRPLKNLAELKLVLFDAQMTTKTSNAQELAQACEKIWRPEFKHEKRLNFNVRAL